LLAAMTDRSPGPISREPFRAAQETVLRDSIARLEETGWLLTWRPTER
jgi:hypothetical protein